jgi:pantoate--beta-alanine ligase
MIIFKRAQQLSEYLEKEKAAGKKIGFVPTMGALHKGHLSLIENSKKSNDLTACSIFVNPTQFTNQDDLKQYPVTTEHDIEQLLSVNCDILFLPTVAEIYPPHHIKKTYALGEIENRLEGHYRPGHFQGVCEVVDRLLQIVQPDNLYLGQKDFQQCIVVKKLLQLLGKEDQVRLNVVPTVREVDGLAMSSRNLRLDAQQRKLANSIFQELNAIKQNIDQNSLEALKATAKTHLAEKGFTVDYVEIANAEDLSPATAASKKIVALAAASTGNIRLIDNLIVN